VSELESRGYRYGKDFLPHDAKVKELGTGKTRVETLSKLGRKVALIPNAKIIDGIKAARQLLPKCWFDAVKCKDGLEALRQYQCAWDDKRRYFVETPDHDWTSHCADAFRYLAMAQRQLRGKGEISNFPRPLFKPTTEFTYTEWSRFGRLESRRRERI